MEDTLKVSVMTLRAIQLHALCYLFCVCLKPLRVYDGQIRLAKVMLTRLCA